MPFTYALLLHTRHSRHSLPTPSLLWYLPSRREYCSLKPTAQVPAERDEGHEIARWPVRASYYDPNTANTFTDAHTHTRSDGVAQFIRLRDVAEEMTKR